MAIVIAAFSNFSGVVIVSLAAVFSLVTQRHVTRCVTSLKTAARETSVVWTGNK